MEAKVGAHPRDPVHTYSAALYSGHQMKTTTFEPYPRHPAIPHRTHTSYHRAMASRTVCGFAGEVGDSSLDVSRQTSKVA